MHQFIEKINLSCHSNFATENSTLFEEFYFARSFCYSIALLYVLSNLHSVVHPGWPVKETCRYQGKQANSICASSKFLSLSQWNNFHILITWTHMCAFTFRRNQKLPHAEVCYFLRQYSCISIPVEQLKLLNMKTYSLYPRKLCGKTATKLLI